MHPLKLAVTALAATLLAGSAFAQKSQDTLRLAVNDPFSALSQYCQPSDEAGNFYRRVYGTLVRFDERNHRIVPGLAKTWKRIDPLTLEFELQENVTFHNGAKFDADDIVSTLEYLSDAKYPIEFKSRYDWITKVEKLGPYKVRVISATPVATGLGLLAYRTFIQNKAAFDGLDSKCDYGRLTPYGTGPFKVTSIDKNAGIVVERFDDLKGDPAFDRAPIKRIHGIPIPDPQTRVAQIMTGGVDMIRNVSPESAEELAKNPDLKVSTLKNLSFVYIVFDAAGRSNVKAMTDPRVRRAMWMAMDRDSIIKNIVPGGKEGLVEKMNMLCFDQNIACGHTKDFPPYDPATAKKLMAEAGYANGFDLVYTCFQPIKTICEAIAGDLLKIGVRAKVEAVPIQLFRKKQSDGELNLLSVFYPSAGDPDVGNIFDVFFVGNRDYSRDPKMQDLVAKGLSVFDEDERRKFYTAGNDLNAEQNYVMAFSSLPTLYVHSKDVEIKPNLLSAGDYYIDDYFWK